MKRTNLAVAANATVAPAADILPRLVASGLATVAAPPVPTDALAQYLSPDQLDAFNVFASVVLDHQDASASMRWQRAEALAKVWPPVYSEYVAEERMTVKDADGTEKVYEQGESYYVVTGGFCPWSTWKDTIATVREESPYLASAMRQAYKDIYGELPSAGTGTGKGGKGRSAKRTIATIERRFAAIVDDYVKGLNGNITALHMQRLNGLCEQFRNELKAIAKDLKDADK